MYSILSVNTNGKESPNSILDQMLI